jgi:hypothetical protein
MLEYLINQFLGNVTWFVIMCGLTVLLIFSDHGKEKQHKNKLTELLRKLWTTRLDTMARDLETLLEVEDPSATKATLTFIKNWSKAIPTSAREWRDSEFTSCLQIILNEPSDLKKDDDPFWSVDYLSNLYKKIFKASLLLRGKDGLALDLSKLDEKQFSQISNKVFTWRDGRLKDSIKIAMKRCRSSGTPIGDYYEDGEYRVVPLADLPHRKKTIEVEHGIWCKASNEFGIETVFYGDYETVYSYYRSDERFMNSKAISYW